MTSLTARRRAIKTGSFDFFNRLAILVFPLLLVGFSALAQSTDIAIGSTVIQPSVKRMGMNLGTLSNYDSGQMLKNLVSLNPGFEGQTWNSTIRCASGSATSCVDEDIYSAWTNGFWQGGTYEIFYGAAAGRSGTITYSSAANGSSGAIINFGDSGVAPAQGDYMIVRKTFTDSTGGWFPSSYGAGSFSDNLTDLPPGTSGKETVALNAPGASDEAVLSYYFDSTQTRSFVQLNGNFQLQFKAKGTGGSNSIGISLSRGTNAPYLSQTVALTNGWNTYNLYFAASETGSALGTVALQFSTAFGADSFELDDVSLVQTDGDATNNTVFRDAVVQALRAYNPGILRFWGGQLGDTLNNLLTPAFGRQRAGFSAYSTAAGQIDYGLHDFLVLCQAVGAEPWIVVPTNFDPADASNLIDYLGGSSSTIYGAKRIALGQTTPWTQVFPTIHLEFGNEAWNSAFTGGAILYAAPYGQRSQSIFAAMIANPNFASGTFDLVLGGHAASPGFDADVQNNCNNNTSFDIAPYTMNEVDSYSDTESLYGPTFAEPEALMSSASTTSAEQLSPGMVYQDSQIIQTSTHAVPLSFYEINLSTLQGAIPQTQLNNYVTSLGAGLMVADTMLQGLKQFGVVNQALFALPQYSFKETNGETVSLWGTVIDMGVTNVKRPQFLALQLANQALSSGASMLQTVHTGADPTWNQALVNTVQMTGAHDLQSYAFQQGTNLSVIVFNLSRTTALPVTFSGVNAPAGTVQMSQLTSANISDTNENSSVINIVSSMLTGFSGAAGLTLPPYSETVLTWSTSTGAPAISGVTASGLSSTGATITWTTDEAASSQVQYGTTASYGSTASGSSTPSSSHAVSLTGLTAGKTYNYAVTSANSGGASSTSANFTFTTPMPAPVISAVTVTGITTTSATISWTTDQPADTELFYGATASTSATSANSALTTSHSVTLTGLLVSTTYSYQITSANSAGLPGRTATMTFSTVGAPVISAVSVIAITQSSATITWTTDQASSSQVVFGTTSGYGSATTFYTTQVTTHSVTVTGLTGGMTYDYAVASTNSYSLTSTSGNFTFTTAPPGPAISSVSAGGISNTSVTISWTTDQASTSQVNYGTTTTYGSSTTVNSALVTSHTVTLSGLASGTTYDYVVASVNSSGSASTSVNFTFSTLGGTVTNTNIAISGTVQQPSVKRLGINLGTLDFFDSGQLMQNLITSNPGFEGQIWNSTIRCAAGTATSCVDENQYSSWPAGFWNGATFQVFYGAAAGRTGTVSTSTAVGSGKGVTLNFASSGTAPAAGDYLIVRKTMAGGSTGGWYTSNYGAATVSDNLSDLPPGTQGKQTVLLNAPTANDLAVLSTFFDSTSGASFVQLNGTFQLQFKAKPLGGSNQIGVQLQRYGVGSYLSQNVTLASGWNTYNLTFTASENGSAVGTVGLAFSTVYGVDSFELDDVSLTRLNTDPTNPTVFRDSVVTALRKLQPGLLRYWGLNGQLGETLDNMLAPQFGRQRAGYSSGSSQSTQIDYGLHEFLVLCQTLGAEPWVVVPSTFSTTDAYNLIDYLASSSSTTYGAKRAALGQTTPWTQVFPVIHLEFGSQEWNTAFEGGSILYANPYGAEAQTIFAAMKSNPSYSAASLDLVLGGEAGSPSFNTAVQNNCNNNTSFDIAPYTMGTVNSFSDNESLFGSTFAEPEALMSSDGLTMAEGLTPGMVYQDYQAIQTSNHPVPLSFSEINLATLSGSITQQALNSYVSSLGAGLMVADTMLQGLSQYGVVNQGLYALAGYDEARPDGSTIYLPGAVVDTGVSNRKRPQFLALQLANQALSTGASMLQTVQTGGNPTWSQSLLNTVQINNAHYIQSYAFSLGTNLSAVIFNLSRTNALPVTFSGVDAPGGTVQMQQLTSANLTDTNETSNVVSITASTFNSFNSASSIALPPYSMTVLTWTQQVTNQTPVISSVMATAVTTTSATITWTTDQATSSQVNYGTTTGYGSSSALNSTLVTSHSVMLTGLTAGTTYNFDVASTNSIGTAATSPNATFSTSVGTPVISAVTVSGLTASSATITWTTDQLTSSLVNYGTTTGYGSASTLNSSLVTSHSVTLTGLTAGTSYNFDVVSANASGTSTTSSNGTFTTLAPTPVISAVTAIGMTSTSAAITWTTDQATSSLVNYGKTSSYGSSSTLNSSLVTSHSVTLTGLTAATTYNFDVVSANSGGTSATSPNATFATLAGTPVISAVTVTGVTASSATITWATDQSTSSLVNYGASTAYGSSSTLNSTLVTSHSVTIAGLAGGATYNFDVVSANINGTAATSSNATFTTVTPLNSASYSGLDTTTQGAWTASYGTDGYYIPNYGSQTPSYATVSFTGSSLWTWATHSTDVRAPQTPAGGFAAKYYGTPNFSVNVNLTDGNAHRVALYLLDWENAIPTETISILDGTTLAVLSTQTFSNFQNGQYATWTLRGNVIIQLTGSSGTAVSGIFFGAAPAASSAAVSFAGNDATTQGTWTGHYGADGYVIANGTNSTPAYATMTLPGTGTWSYSTTTTDPRALQTAPNSSSRIASDFYPSSGSSFTINLNLTDGNTHKVSLYLLDWDTTARTEVITLQDATTKTILSQQSYASFQNGVYAPWNIKGNVMITVYQTGGQNAVVSGIFFGGSSTPAPVISAVTTTAVTSTSATVTWTTDQASTSQVNYGATTAYGLSSTLNSNLVTSHSVTLTGLTPGTTYNFDVVSANSGGNAATSPNATFSTLAGTPVISAVAATSITANSATITWTTDQATSSLVNYGTTTGYGSASTLNSSLVTSHSVTLTGLTAGTTYNFDVVSANSGGTSATSPNATFATLAGTPVISAVTATSITSTSAIITWTTDQATSSLVNYGKTTSYGSASTLNSSLVTSHSVTLTGLTAATTYDFDVVSANSGGTTATSPNATFATSAAGAPVISAVTATSITSTSATITWTTDQSSSSLVNYGTTSGYGSSSTLNSSLVTSHSVTLTGLTAATTYNFDVVSANSGGTSATSPNATFATSGTSSGNSASYSGLDTTTQGAWTASYGTDGYYIPNYGSQTPTYATVSFTGSSLWTWATHATDVRALQTPAGGFAAKCYGTPNFSVNVNLTDGNAHRVALYLLDWENAIPTETISILDGTTQAVLSTQTFSNFQNGQYATWTLRGNVIIQLSGSSGTAVSGIFFGAAPAASSAAVSFAGNDATTQGTWTGHYGADGYIIANATNSTPSYATMSLVGTGTWTYSTTTDPRALQTASNSSSRIASDFYPSSGSSFTINLNLTDGNTHKVSLYLLDWDTTARTEVITIQDATTHTYLSQQSYASFQNGVYAPWNIKGNVTITVYQTGGQNAVVSGIFFK